MADTLHSLLQDSAKKHPTRAAVRYKDQSISYRQLDEASDRLAASLMNHGVGVGDRIGLYIDKTIDAVTGVFGIMKAGGCYVPLDPGGPLERQAAIISDCGLERLVVGANKLPRLRQILQNIPSLKELYLMDTAPGVKTDLGPGISTILPDAVRASQADVAGRSNQVTKKNLAYILYTSGSTGRPKGVMISHGASRAFVDWACKDIGLTERDVVSSHAPFHFDLSVFDLYSTVRAGATICIVPQGLSSFPSSLAGFIEKEKIAVWYSVPTILIQLIEHGELDKRDLSNLRTIIFAGEVFPTRHLRRLMGLVPRVEFFNYYGPTETNVCASYKVPGIPATDDPVPIGIPCDGQIIGILDEEGHLVKTGEKGELFVHGPTLMDGYWGDAEKTARSFRTVPLLNGQTLRAYKTGDLVSLRSDGNLAYYGRFDHMIKSRGYRIELGEIEAALAAHPQVREAAVVGIPDEEIGRKIAAAVVLSEGAKLSENEMKLFCSSRLPQYMIPEIFSFRDSLPHTSTNKIDRKQIEGDFK